MDVSFAETKPFYSSRDNTFLPFDLEPDSEPHPQNTLPTLDTFEQPVEIAEFPQPEEEEIPPVSNLNSTQIQPPLILYNAFLRFIQGKRGPFHSSSQIYLILRLVSIPMIQKFQILSFPLFSEKVHDPI